MKLLYLAQLKQKIISPLLRKFRQLSNGRLTFTTREAFWKFYIFPKNRDSWENEVIAPVRLSTNPVWTELTPKGPDKSKYSSWLAFMRFEKLQITPQTVTQDFVANLEEYFTVHSQKQGTLLVKFDDWLYRFRSFIDIDYVKSLLTKYSLENTIKELHLPLTSCHGDLLPKNVFKNECGNLIIIDWETYQPEGSFYEDISTLSIGAARESHHPGDDVLSAWQAYWLDLKCLTKTQAFILYSINRLVVSNRLSRKCSSRNYRDFENRLIEIHNLVKEYSRT